jgi:DNA-binding response OmpR family regulator
VELLACGRQLRSWWCEGEEVANETILIVDADTKSQKVLEVNFKKAGYRVMITETMAQAQELLAAETPELIITDTRLPDGDGFALCEYIKQQPLLRDVPLIFLTEDGALPRKMRGFELGATDYLTKPIYIKEIVGRVELALQQRAKSMLSDADAELIEGDLAEITVVDLLQTIEVELRSGTIQLERNGIQATVYFQEGNILDAICGKLQGEEALYRLMLWPKGRFAVRYHESIKRPDIIEKDSTTLLLEGMRRLDRWNEMVVTLPHLSRIFEPDYKRLTQISDDLPVEVVRLVRLFDGYRTLRDAIDDSPVDDLTTLHILRKLLEDEVLQDVTPQEAPLSHTSQHTNLATWLAARPELAEEHKASREALRTAPGFQNLHDAQGDEAAAAVEPGEEGLSEPISETLEAREEEEGQVPGGHQQEERSWSFHWDKEAQGAAPEAEPASDAVEAPAPVVEEPAPVVDPQEAMRLFAEQEERRREEEARQLASHQIASAPEVEEVVEEPTLEEASGLLNEPAPGAERQLDVWMRGGTQRRSIDPEQKVEGDDVYVPRDPTQEMHRNVMLAQIEEQAEARERMNTPLAMPAQAPEDPTRRPTPRDPYEGIEDMLAARGAPVASREAAPAEATPAEATPAEPEAREAALEESEAIQREAVEQLQRGGQEEAAEGERRRTTDQFAAIRPDQVAATPDPLDIEPPAVTAPAVEETAAPLIALGSPEDQASEPEVEASPAISGADAFQEEDEEDEEDEGEDEEEDEEDDEDEGGEESADAAPVVAADSSSELRIARENKDIPLPHRTARDHELIHTEYNLSARKTSPPREKLDPENLPVEAAAPAAAPAAQDDKKTVKLGAVKKPAEPLLAPVEATLEETMPASKPEPEAPAPVDTPVVEAAPSEPAAPIDPLMVDPPPLRRRSDDTMDDLLAVDPQSGFNFKGLAIVAVVILVLMITLLVVFNSSDDNNTVTPPVAAKQDMAPPVDAGAPDLAEVAVAPDAAPDLAQAVALDAAGAELSATALGDASVLRAARLALLFSGVDPESVADPLHPDAVADMGEAPDMVVEPDMAAPAADMAVAVVEEDMAKAVTPPDPVEVAPPSFDEQLTQAERFVRNESMNKAKKILRNLVKEQPENPKVHYLLGRSEVGANNGGAIQSLIKAKMLGYDDPELFVHLGTAYQINGDTDKARKNYEEYLKRAPSGKMAKEIRAVLNRL